MRGATPRTDPTLNTILPADWPATIEDARALQQRVRGEVVTEGRVTHPP